MKEKGYFRLCKRGEYGEQFGSNEEYSQVFFRYQGFEGRESGIRSWRDFGALRRERCRKIHFNEDSQWNLQ